MDEFELYTYEVNHETGDVKVFGWTRHVGSPRKNYIERFDNLRDALSKYPDACDTNPGNDCLL